MNYDNIVSFMATCMHNYHDYLIKYMYDVCVICHQVTHIRRSRTAYSTTMVNFQWKILMVWQIFNFSAILFSKRGVTTPPPPPPPPQNNSQVDGWSSTRHLSASCITFAMHHGDISVKATTDSYSFRILKYSWCVIPTHK